MQIEPPEETFKKGKSRQIGLENKQKDRPDGLLIWCHPLTLALGIGFLRTAEFIVSTLFLLYDFLPLLWCSKEKTAGEDLGP